jgi:transposase
VNVYPLVCWKPSELLAASKAARCFVEGGFQSTSRHEESAPALIDSVMYPGFRWLGLLELRSPSSRGITVPKRYPSEFRQRVLALLDEARRVVDVAHDLGLPQQTIYNWRNQQLIDRGERPGLSAVESVELRAACSEIVRLRAEVEVSR